jgi:hypothetical protein
MIDSEVGFDESHTHECLPGLTWIPTHNQKAISKRVAVTSDKCWDVFQWDPNHGNDDVLALLRDFDFRKTCDSTDLMHVMNWLHLHVRF